MWRFLQRDWPPHGWIIISIELHVCRPRKDEDSVDLISDVLPFGRLWYEGPNAASNAIDYAKFRRRSDKAVI